MNRLFQRFALALIGYGMRTKPSFIIGGEDNPYLARWWLIPRNPLLNVYLHLFLRSDDDRALHDHPWANVSVLLDGRYIEHTIDAGGIHRRRRLEAGDIRARLSGKFAHRIELDSGPCWTLFITGPKYRSWGFHCEKAGWIHWARFTSPDDSGSTGKGCEG